jgi:alpha-L-fucosidase
MFQSSLTPYNVADATPFKRDVTRELVDACRDAGLRFGCYYSVDRDWYRPQGPGNSYKQANIWDYPDSKREDFDRYFNTFAKPQVVELMTKYRPDLLWFDEIDMKTDAQVEELYQTIRRLRPECIINSRIQGCRFPAKIPPPHCDYITSGDNEILEKNIGFEWENPGSMNTSYGYNPNDHNWVSAAEIVSNLVNIVSKGGNYLLNVGPTPEGLIPQPCIDRLAKVGEWMEVNGEAIFGTSASVFGDSAPPSAGNWRCTVKPGKIYLHLFKWPASGKFEVQGLQSKVTKAYLLAGRKELKVEQTTGGVSISLPAEAPDKIASVICLEIADPVAKVVPQK